MNKLNLLIKFNELKRIGHTQKREKKNVFQQKVSFNLSRFLVTISKAMWHDWKGLERMISEITTFKISAFLLNKQTNKHMRRDF